MGFAFQFTLIVLILDHSLSFYFFLKKTRTVKRINSPGQHKETSIKTSH